MKKVPIYVPTGPPIKSIRRNTLPATNHLISLLFSTRGVLGAKASYMGPNKNKKFLAKFCILQYNSGMKEHKFEIGDVIIEKKNMWDWKLVIVDISNEHYTLHGTAVFGMSGAYDNRLPIFMVDACFVYDPAWANGKIKEMVGIDEVQD